LADELGTQPNSVSTVKKLKMQAPGLSTYTKPISCQGGLLSAISRIDIISKVNFCHAKSPSATAFAGFCRAEYKISLQAGKIQSWN